MDEAQQAEVDGILIATGGPVSAHHMLMHLAKEHRVTLHSDVAEVDNGAAAAAALEIWQTPDRGAGRWRWLLLRAGAVVEEAPGDVHHLRPYETVALTVTRSTLPDREAVKAFRVALRNTGASCTLCRPMATPSTAVRESVAA